MKTRTQNSELWPGSKVATSFSPAKSAIGKLASLIGMLSVAAWAASAQQQSPVTILTQNMDSATDLGYVVVLGAPVGVDLTLAEVEASNLPQRAGLLAAQIAARKPDS